MVCTQIQASTSQQEWMRSGLHPTHSAFDHSHTVMAHTKSLPWRSLKMLYSCQHAQCADQALERNSEPRIAQPSPANAQSLPLHACCTQGAILPPER